MLLIAAASATELVVGPEDDLCEALLDADTTSSLVVYLSGEHHDDCASLQLEGVDLTVQGADRATTTLPPIELQRSTFLAKDLWLPAGETPSLLDLGAELLGYDAVPVSLAASSSNVTLAHVDVTGHAGAGIVALQGTLDLSDVAVTDFLDWAGLYVFAGTDDGTTLTVDEGSRFADDASGAIVLSAEGLGEIAASIADTTFERNRGYGGADVHALAVTTLGIERATFRDSFGMNDDAEAGTGAPIYVEDTALALTSCDFFGTDGQQATYLVQYGGTLAVSGGTWAGLAATNSYAVMANGSSLALDDVTVEQPETIGAVWLNGDSVAVTRSRFHGGGHVRPTPLLWLPWGGTSVVTDNTFCNVDGTEGGELVDAVGDLTFERNLVRQVDLAGVAVANTGRVTARDNTVVDSDTDFVGGDPDPLVYVNNLVAGARIAVTAAPRSLDAHHNLFWDVTWVETGYEEGVVEADPRLADTYVATDCAAAPAITANSPANGAGDPAVADSYGNTPSDIGALDVDGEPAGGDTGDPNVPGDLAEESVLVELAGGLACGEDAAAILLLPFLTLRRRRPC
ncbi:MAG: hypothetical protein ACOZNI_04885 [Myxococcota bacterium]